jgi:hypothetical protein
LALVHNCLLNTSQLPSILYLGELVYIVSSIWSRGNPHSSFWIYDSLVIIIWFIEVCVSCLWWFTGLRIKLSWLSFN